jgi:hypothetical protein
MKTRPKWVLQVKKFAAQNLGGQYFSSQAGDFTSPRFCKGGAHG